MEGFRVGKRGGPAVPKGRLRDCRARLSGETTQPPHRWPSDLQLHSAHRARPFAREVRPLVALHGPGASRIVGGTHAPYVAGPWGELASVRLVGVASGPQRRDPHLLSSLQRRITMRASSFAGYASLCSGCSAGAWSFSSQACCFRWRRAGSGDLGAASRRDLAAVSRPRTADCSRPRSGSSRRAADASSCTRSRPGCDAVRDPGLWSF